MSEAAEMVLTRKWNRRDVSVWQASIFEDGGGEGNLSLARGTILVMSPLFYLVSFQISPMRREIS